MSTTQELIGLGIPSFQAQRMGDTTANTLTATGTTQGTALLIGSSINIFTTVTASNNSCVLPTDAQFVSNPMPYDIQIINNGASQLQVFPPVGSSINSYAANLGFTLDVGCMGNFKRISSTLYSEDGHIGAPQITISAAGNSQGTATVLGALVSEITTCAASAGVVLPTSMQIGQWAFVINAGANALTVYPPGAATFYNSGASVSVGVGKCVTVIRTSATQFYAQVGA
jgi:hypothetical protein